VADGSGWRDLAKVTEVVLWLRKIENSGQALTKVFSETKVRRLLILYSRVLFRGQSSELKGWMPKGQREKGDALTGFR
jgi:hypothetical protein